MKNLNTITSIIKLKNKLISEIPFTPNNKDSKIYLSSLDIGFLIHIYDFWQQRLIYPAPRETVVSSKVRNSLLYVRHRAKINGILKKVRCGVDIAPYLSNSAHSGTFDVEEFKRTGDFNSFRDQILVCEGFHHLHLEQLPKRTDEVLIAHVTDRIFEVVQVAKHNLFENSHEATMEYEKCIDQFLASKIPEGGYYIGGAGGGMQNLAGSSMQSTHNQIYARKILHHVEIKCGGIEAYSKQLFRYLDGRDTQYVKPEWRMIQRELTLYEKKNQRCFSSQDLLYNFDETHG